MAHLLDVARQHGSPFIIESIADQIANAAPLYVDGTQLQLPQSDLGDRTHICWTLVMTKTAAGVGAPSINVRVGKAGTIADPIRLAFALPAQTAAADTAIVEIEVLIRKGGAAAVLVGACDFDHNGGATGFSTTVSPVVSAVSAAFDLTGDNNTLALSVNPADAVWTIQLARTELALT
jgi:hypothetical protein